MKPFERKRHTKSLRLWFRFKDDHIDLVRQEPVQIIASPSIGSIPKEGKNSGTWIELCDKKDQCISTRIVPGDPFLHITEQVLDGKMVAVVSERESGTFDIVVPYLPEAKSILLFASRERTKARTPKAAKCIGRFALKEQNRPGKKTNE